MDLEYYENREHAKAKHDLLKRYIERYAMILGRHATEIAFVDGFAGPWQSGAADRSDTSFGLSAATLRKCAEALAARFSKRPVIRALWIEEGLAAYELLSEFATRTSSSRISIEAKHASFQDSIDSIVRFVGTDAYSFIFVDPKGYKGLIEPDVIAPLLRMPRAEVLINYMWDHIRYAFGRPDEPGHRANLERLYGSEVTRLLDISDGGARAAEALQVYEQRLREAADVEGRSRLRVLSYPILDTHGRRYPKYWLVHATHAASGLTTFADECEKTNRTQTAIFFSANANRREVKTGMADLFANEESINCKPQTRTPSTQGWLDLLPNIGDSETVDTETWAGLLEQGRCLPADLQEGFKQLRDAGILENVDAKGRRRTRFVHHEDGETIRRLR